MRSTEPFGAATDFAIRYENGYGIPHSAMVTSTIGFAAIDLEDDGNDEVSPCQAVFDYEA